LVYIDGGIEEIEGGWTERGGQVLFTLRGGTLVSVPYEDVDLAASAFITWQLAGRRQQPPRAELPVAPPGEETTPEPQCVGARLLGLQSGETLEVMTGETRETIHVACLDAPETQHRYSEIGWFGRATVSAVQLELKAGAEVCLREQAPPQRDELGHRVVYVTLAGGEDYTGEIIGGGLGLLRPASCSRAEAYRRLENRAMAEQRGLWGAMSSTAAFAAAQQVASAPGGAAPTRRASGGG
jgi:endonuclease YncB( thermonuclease family)